MPELSRFLGIVIAMYYRDHGPPHFHAVYADFEVTIDIDTGKVAGKFPRRPLAYVQEWRLMHSRELLDAWVCAREGRPLAKIQPLELSEWFPV